MPNPPPPGLQQAGTTSNRLNDIADDAAVDIADDAVAVRLDPNLTFQPCVAGGVGIVRVHHRVTNQHFQLGPAEHHVATLLGGCGSATELHRRALADGVDWDRQRLSDFVGELVRQGLASPRVQANTCGGNDSPDRVAARRPSAGALRWAGWVISVRVPLCSPHRVSAKLAGWAAEWLSPAARGTIAAAVLVTLLVASLHGAALTAGTRTILSRGDWVTPLVLWAALKVLHELGHAVAAAGRGVRLGRGGVMFFMMAPIAYVDVSDAWRLPRAADRIAIAAGGIVAELIVASIAFWTWWSLPVGEIRQTALSIFLLAGPATLLVNANPLLRLDGYYILSDLTGIANLREHGRRLLSGVLGRPLGLPAAPVPLDRGRRRIALTHAVASVVFQVAWMGGLVLTLIRGGGVAGILMATVAMGLWIVMPVVRFGCGVWSRAVARDDQLGGRSGRCRLVAASAIGLSLATAVACLPSPMPRPVPVAVRYAGEQTLRAPADAFVDALLVDSGDVVLPGEPLVQLINDDLVIELARAEAQLAAEIIARRQHQHGGALALAQSSARQIESLRRRTGELRARVEALTLRAGAGGVIVTPDPRRIEGTFLNTGDEVIRVGNPDALELIASIDPRDDCAYAGHVAGGRAIAGRLSGGANLSVIPIAANPQASRRLPAASLGATVGGPIAVKVLDPERGPVSVDARREAILPIDPVTSRSVHVGQTGVVWLRDGQPAWRRVWRWVRPGG